eukprot:GGOE01052985.1.p1 GENE.GGOE01052985.1~~GGOE01052985.1.p1  ORF type:complete len:240 (+),score=64.65 GGOE01052985.1:81-800(+)
MDDDFFGEPAAVPPPAPTSGSDDDFFGESGGGVSVPVVQPQAVTTDDDDMFGGGFGVPTKEASPEGTVEVEQEVEPEPVVEVAEAEETVEAELELELEAEPEQPAAPELTPEAQPEQVVEPEEEVEQEVPPLVKWELENREFTARRDQEAQEKLAKIHEDAKEAIEQFYAERGDLATGNRDRNVGAEAEFCKQRDALFAHGDVWERVVSLIDLKGANEKKQTRVSRMRSLLLHMKNEAK